MVPAATTPTDASLPAVSFMVPKKDPRKFEKGRARSRFRTSNTTLLDPLRPASRSGTNMQAIKELGVLDVLFEGDLQVQQYWREH